jgi:hypothetical protein
VQSSSSRFRRPRFGRQHRPWSIQTRRHPRCDRPRLRRSTPSRAPSLNFMRRRRDQWNMRRHRRRMASTGGQVSHDEASDSDCSTRCDGMWSIPSLARHHRAGRRADARCPRRPQPCRGVRWARQPRPQHGADAIQRTLLQL